MAVCLTGHVLILRTNFPAKKKKKKKKKLGGGFGGRFEKLVTEKRTIEYN